MSKKDGERLKRRRADKVSPLPDGAGGVGGGGGSGAKHTLNWMITLV